MLSRIAFTQRNTLIVAVSIGCGLAVTFRPELLSKLPLFVQEVFGSGISVGSLVAVTLNLVLPGSKAEPAEEAQHDEVAQASGELA
ncbi:xanthine permease [compost metagenome]